MVQLTCFNLVRYYNKKFVDKLRIYVRGGSGGAGLRSLGGIGGKGGDVYLVASTDKGLCLRDMQRKNKTKRFLADPGENSRKDSLVGLKGASIYVQVPHGINVVDADSGEELGEILDFKDKICVATGGKGANYHNRYMQKRGTRRNINLDLKTIADVGFVGFPNAGKSTLLSKLSRATPNIADYPFTTVNPELGIMEFDDFRKIQLADLPGLIEGAFMNKGRGHSFLKHIERTSILLYVVDINGFQLNPGAEFRTAFETVQLLTKELELYDESVLQKDALLAINKMDAPGSDKLLTKLIDQLTNYRDHLDTLPYQLVPETQPTFRAMVPVCAQDGAGTAELGLRLREVLDDRRLIHDERPLLKDEGKESRMHKEKKLLEGADERIVLV